MTKAMSRMNRFEAFCAQGLVEIFFTDSVNTVAGKSFTALIDKQAVLVCPFGSCAVFGHVEVEEVNGFGFKLHLSIAVSFTQDGQGLVLRVKVIKTLIERFSASIRDNFCINSAIIKNTPLN